MNKFSTKLLALILTALVISLLAHLVIDGFVWWDHSRPSMIERENLQPVLNEIENSGVDTTKLYTVLRPKFTFWKTFLAQIIGIAIVVFIYGKALKLVSRIANRKRNPNQRIEPIEITPDDEVDAQGSQAHP